VKLRAYEQVRGKNSVQGMHDSGNAKNSVGLKPNAEWKKDAKAPSGIIGSTSALQNKILPLSGLLFDNLLSGIEGALASFFHSALGFSPTLFLALPESCIPCMKFTSPKQYMRPFKG